MKYLSSLFVFLSVLLLGACRQSETDRILSQADRMYELYPDSAYLLLKDLNSEKFINPKQQARYALLYTKAQYKNYVDAPNDSLISIAADYYELHGSDEEKFYAYLYQGIIRYVLGKTNDAIRSLLRALANSDDVSDRYSKGQLYTHLAALNADLHCSDENYYALKAYDEYANGGLEAYQMNALSMRAVAKLHLMEYDSCRILIDSCITYAEESSNSYQLNELKTIKAQMLVIRGKYEEAGDLYRDVVESDEYSLSAQDFTNMALVSASCSNSNQAYSLLGRAFCAISTSNDTINYWAKSSIVGRLLKDSSYVINSQDSLLKYQDGLLRMALSNATNTVQKDYIKWQLDVLEFKSRQRSLVLIGSSICLSLLLLLVLLKYRNNQVVIRLQQERIEKLQLQIAQNSATITKNMEQLFDCNIVVNLREQVRKDTLVHVDWESLSLLFDQNIPYFQNALLQLTTLTEIEWRVCMLIKLGFKPSDISKLVNRSPNAIANIRRRLYEKVFKTKGTSAKWDLFIDDL